MYSTWVTVLSYHCWIWLRANTWWKERTKRKLLTAKFLAGMRGMHDMLINGKTDLSKDINSVASNPAGGDKKQTLSILEEASEERQMMWIKTSFWTNTFKKYYNIVWFPAESIEQRGLSNQWQSSAQTLVLKSRLWDLQTRMQQDF